MKVLLIALLIMIGTSAKAQILVDGKDINADSTLQYIEIVGADIGFFKKKLVICVDYGQKFSIFDGTDTVVKTADGKNKIFNSMTGALNFFVANGWEYVNSYAISVPNNGSVYHWLLRYKQH
jgi:hypothetical protein